MSKSLTDYYKVSNRPNKKKVQSDFYAYIGKQLPIINMVDLPGANIKDVWKMYDELYVERYLAIEQDETIANTFECNTWQGEALDLLRTRSLGWKVNFFNLDFCNAFGPAWNIYSLPFIWARHGAQKAFAIVTFNPRGPSHPGRKLDLTINNIMQEHNLKVKTVEKQTYKDTSAMCSWLIGWEHEMRNQSQSI